MISSRNILKKQERLSWDKEIKQLFAEGESFVAYPFRVVYLTLDTPRSIPASILISVSKKRFKRAVKRNCVKRQVREAYRTRKHPLLHQLNDAGKSMLIAFLYLDKEIHPHVKIEKAMDKAIARLVAKNEPKPTAESNAESL